MFYGARAFNRDAMAKPSQGSVEAIREEQDDLGSSSRHFTARDISHLHGKNVVVKAPYMVVAKGTTGVIGEGRRTPEGWLLEILWTSGPHRGSSDWLTRNEFTNHIRIE